MNTLADSPVSTGEELIVIAILDSVLLYISYNIITNKPKGWMLKTRLLTLPPEIFFISYCANEKIALILRLKIAVQMELSRRTSRLRSLMATEHVVISFFTSRIDTTHARLPLHANGRALFDNPIVQSIFLCRPV